MVGIKLYLNHNNINICIQHYILFNIISHPPPILHPCLPTPKSISFRTPRRHQLMQGVMHPLSDLRPPRRSN